MPIRRGSPPPPTRSKDDSEDEDDVDGDESQSHQKAHANAKRNAESSSGSGSKSDHSQSNNNSSSHVIEIPPMQGWAPAIFVPAKFDYTQPQLSEEEEQAKPPHQRLNDLLADLDAHAAAVRSNHAWMVVREAQRVQQEALAQEAKLLAEDKPLPRSKRLPPTEADEAALIRNMSLVPLDLQQHPNQRRHSSHSNPNTIPTNPLGSGSNMSAAQPSPYEVPQSFSYREVQARFADPRDTPREAAVTQVLNVAGDAMHHANWYSNFYQARRNNKITSYVGERAKSFVPEPASPTENQGGATIHSSPTAITPTKSSSTSGAPKRRASFGGGGSSPMDLD
ncbi:hypothetical protein PG987_012249 [Apiospora arundinis]